MYVVSSNKYVPFHKEIVLFNMFVNDSMVWYGNILFDIVHNIIENILTKHKNI